MVLDPKPAEPVTRFRNTHNTKHPEHKRHEKKHFISQPTTTTHHQNQKEILQNQFVIENEFVPHEEDPHLKKERDEAARRRYKAELEAQIKDKKRREAEERRRSAAKDEEIERLVREQRARMAAEYEREQREFAARQDQAELNGNGGAKDRSAPTSPSKGKLGSKVGTAADQIKSSKEVATVANRRTTLRSPTYLRVHPTTKSKAMANHQQSNKDGVKSLDPLEVRLRQTRARVTKLLDNGSTKSSASYTADPPDPATGLPSSQVDEFRSKYEHDMIKEVFSQRVGNEREGDPEGRRILCRLSDMRRQLQANAREEPVRYPPSQAAGRRGSAAQRAN